MTNSTKYVEKLLDLSYDRSGTLKYILKLVEDPDYIMPTKLLCPNHNQADDFCFEEKCYFCDAKGCVKCDEQFKVDGRYVCYDCYEYSCVEFDECVLYDGVFNVCDNCAGLGWNIGWIQKK